jgi:hypothetical protein
MCLRRAPEKYIAGSKAPAGAALDRAGIHFCYRRLEHAVHMAYRENIFLAGKHDNKSMNWKTKNNS